MPTITITAARSCHALAPAVLRQLGGGRDAIQSAIEAAKHGADAGFHGFIYRVDTSRFARRNSAAILACLSDDADGMGMTMSDMLASFKCVAHSDGIDRITVDRYLAGMRIDDFDRAMLDDALAWYALESVGHAIASMDD